MSDLIKRRLAALSEEIARARTELGVLREQLAFHERVLEERTVEMLVAETPIAAREHRIAREDRDRTARLVQEEEWSLNRLRDEQDRLLERIRRPSSITTSGRSTL